MDARKAAEEAVKAIFDEAENHMRTIGRDWAIDAAEKAIRSHMASNAKTPGWAGKAAFLMSEDAMVVSIDGCAYKFTGKQALMAKAAAADLDALPDQFFVEGATGREQLKAMLYRAIDEQRHA